MVVSKRGRVGLAVAMVAMGLTVMGLLVWKLRQLPEPSYQGKTSSSWFERYQASTVSTVSKAGQPRVSLARALALEPPVTLSLTPPAPPFPPSAVQVPARIVLEDTEEIRAFRNLGDKVVPFLLKALLSRDANISAKASHILANLECYDPKMVAALVRVMGTKEPGWHRLCRGCWQKIPGSVRTLLPRPAVPNMNPMAFSIALPGRFHPLTSGPTPGPAAKTRSLAAAPEIDFSSGFLTQVPAPVARRAWTPEPVAVTYATAGVASPGIIRVMGHGHIPQGQRPSSFRSLAISWLFGGRSLGPDCGESTRFRDTRP